MIGVLSIYFQTGWIIQNSPRFLGVPASSHTFTITKLSKKDLIS